MTDTTKRIRITDRLRKEADNTFCRISNAFRDCQREGTPLNATSALARAIRTEREWPPSISYELYCRTDALWKHLVNCEAVWVLYLDGEVTNSDEISAKRSAGDEGVWDRVCGHFEWRSHPGKPFYEGEAPKLLSSQGAHAQ